MAENGKATEVCCVVRFSLFGNGSKRKPQRGTQVAVGSIFPFTNRVFRYPVFLTHTCLKGVATVGFGRNQKGSV